MPDGFKMGSPQSQTAFFIPFREGLESIIGGGCNEGQGQNGNGQGAGEQIPLAVHHDDEYQVSEEADYNGRQGRQGFNGNAKRIGHLAGSGIFRHVNTGHHANGN